MLHLLLTRVFGDDQPALVVAAAAGASVWTSWVVNLLVVGGWSCGRPTARSRPCESTPSIRSPLELRGRPRVALRGPCLR